MRTAILSFVLGATIAGAGTALATTGSTPFNYGNIHCGGSVTASGTSQVSCFRVEPDGYPSGYGVGLNDRVIVVRSAGGVTVFAKANPHTRAVAR